EQGEARPWPEERQPRHARVAAIAEEAKDHAERVGPPGQTAQEEVPDDVPLPLRRRAEVLRHGATPSRPARGARSPRPRGPAPPSPGSPGNPGHCCGSAAPRSPPPGARPPRALWGGGTSAGGPPHPLS